MKDMKLIMESWRQYSSHRATVPMVLIENGEIVCFDLNERLRTLNESNNAKEINVLFEKWLVQTEAMLNEGVVSDFFGGVKEKAAELTGKAKQFFTEFMENPFLTMGLQLMGFLEKIKDVGISALAKAADIVSKINAAKESFKEKNPLLYDILVVIVVVATIALVSYGAYYLITKYGTAFLAKTATGSLKTAGGEILDQGSDKARRIVAAAMETDPDMGRKLAGLVESPDANNIADLSESIRQAIADAVEKVSSLETALTQNTATYGPEVAQVDANRLQRLTDAGKEILEKVSAYNNTDLARQAAKFLPK